MYKSFLKIYLLIFFVSCAASFPVNAKPIKENCHEQFNKITIAEIQNIFSKPESWTTYKGQEGYLLFARKSPNIDSMDYLFRLVSKALGTNFQQLGWQKYQSSVESFLKERSQILDEQNNLKQEFLGMEGYVNYAAKYHRGDMQKASLNVSAVLDNLLFQQLGWQHYQGSTEDFLDEKDQILDEQGNLKQEFLGMEGYAQYAKQYYKNKMPKAFQNISAALDNSVFKQLGWQQYYGSVGDFFKERGQILDKQGNLKQKYLGLEGYARYAKKYHQGNMQKAFQNVSAVLDKKIFQQLGWQSYNGSIQDFQSERKQILDDKGKPKKKYLGMDGYTKYAEDYYQGNMFKAFTNVSAVLGGIQSLNNLSLNWKQFRGSVSEYYNLLQLFKDHPFTTFEGLEGQKKAAEEVFQGRWQRTYKNVSAFREVLLGSREAFHELNWSASLK